MELYDIYLKIKSEIMGRASKLQRTLEIDGFESFS
jgi:hypothetical protein